MTDLEKRADEYAVKVAEKNVMPKDGFAEHLIRQAYLDATKAETAFLSQHILDLQKDKGNLTDRVRELEAENEQIKNSDSLCRLIGEQKIKIQELENENKHIYARMTRIDKVLDEKIEKIAELESQIEKMKRCSICKYSTDLGYCKIRCNGGECNKMDKWEIKEND